MAQTTGNPCLQKGPQAAEICHIFLVLTPSLIGQYVDFQRRHDVPLWMGESGENTYEWIAAFRELLEANGIGWCFWTYKRLDTDRSVVSVERPPEWDEIAAFAEHPRSTFKEVRESRPRREVIDQALGDFLDRVAFQACRVNPGYLAALGLGWRGRKLQEGGL